MKRIEFSMNSPLMSLRSSSCKSPDMSSRIEELNSLPSISRSSQSSDTLSPEEINQVMRKSKIINNQVQLRLSKFMARSSSVVNSIENEKRSRSIVVGTEYMNEIKNQHEYILSLIEQASILQSEVENTAEIVRCQKEVTAYEEPTAKKECRLDKCGLDHGISCSCLVF